MQSLQYLILATPMYSDSPCYYHYLYCYIYYIIRTLLATPLLVGRSTVLRSIHFWHGRSC